MSRLSDVSLTEDRQRNDIEGQFGQENRRFGLGLIRENRRVTERPSIALTILIKNLEKLLQVLFL